MKGNVAISALLAVTAALVLVASAFADPPAVRVRATGAVDPMVGFSSFHITGSVGSDGTVKGRAVFDDVPEAAGRLVVEVTCVRIGTDVDSTDGSMRRFAILTGSVQAAANGVGIGRPVIVGLIDGEQSTPAETADTVDADFALDMPAITCETPDSLSRASHPGQGDD